MKKATKTKGEHPELHAVENSDDNGVCIKDVLLQKLLRFDAELKNALLSQQGEEYKWQLETHAHTQRVAALQQATSQAQAEFKNIVSEIESEYSVDMRKYAYDPDTGLLTRIAG